MKPHHSFVYTLYFKDVPKINGSYRSLLHEITQQPLWNTHIPCCRTSSLYRVWFNLWSHPNLLHRVGQSQPDIPINTFPNNVELNTRLVISVRLARYLLCCVVVHVFHARRRDFVHCPLLTTPPSRALSPLQWLVEHVFPAREQTAFP